MYTCNHLKKATRQMISFDLELRKSVTEIWSEFTSIHADWMDRQGWTQLIAHSFPAVACQSRNKGRKDNSWAEREKWIPNIPKYLSNSFDMSSVIVWPRQSSPHSLQMLINTINEGGHCVSNQCVLSSLPGFLPKIFKKHFGHFPLE